MNTPPSTFSKQEHLCGKTTIENLFQKNNSFLHFPIRVLYQIEETPTCHVPAKILITVSKKYFKKAVHRNTIKRKMREAYRQNKTPLTSVLSKQGKSIRVGFLYISKEEFPYQKIEGVMKECINKLVFRIENLDKA
jgi:ribonuclease P protein component